MSLQENALRPFHLKKQVGSWCLSHACDFFFDGDVTTGILVMMVDLELRVRASQGDAMLHHLYFNKNITGIALQTSLLVFCRSLHFYLFFIFICLSVLCFSLLVGLSSLCLYLYFSLCVKWSLVWLSLSLCLFVSLSLSVYLSGRLRVCWLVCFLVCPLTVVVCLFCSFSCLFVVVFLMSMDEICLSRFFCFGLVAGIDNSVILIRFYHGNCRSNFWNRSRSRFWIWMSNVFQWSCQRIFERESRSCEPSHMDLKSFFWYTFHELISEFYQLIVQMIGSSMKCSHWWFFMK